MCNLVLANFNSQINKTKKEGEKRRRKRKKKKGEPKKSTGRDDGQSNWGEHKQPKKEKRRKK
jgi:hypothetical protein